MCNGLSFNKLGKYYEQGTAANPGITFSGDNDTGLFRSAANGLSVTLGGVEQVKFLSNAFEFLGTAPELRFGETDQTDPAGRYRLKVNGDVLSLDRALTANWATSTPHLEIDGNVTITAGTVAGFRAQIRLIQGYDSEVTTGIRFGTADYASSTIVDHLYIPVAASPVTIQVLNASLNMNGGELKKLVSLRGNGADALTLRTHTALTDANGIRISLYALDPATDTEYIVANVVPDGAVPKFTMRAPDDAPSTTELDDEHVTFGFTKATDTLTMYVREGANVKTLVLGVAV